MQIKESSMPGCVEVFPRVFEDHRGVFVKTFQESIFNMAGIEIEFPEWAVSRSSRGVVRGLHFQTPPMAQDKLVYCVSGAVLDVAVDLRKGSPTYGTFETFPLDDRDFHAVLVPKGFGHGFVARSDTAVVSYLMSAEYSPDHDGGIRWDSLPIAWDVEDPILSEKDQTLPLFDTWESPFTFEGA